MSFQNLFKSWESQNVLAYEVFLNWNKKKKKTKQKKPKQNNFELKFSLA